jgi:hypothetical protein
MGLKAPIILGASALPLLLALTYERMQGYIVARLHMFNAKLAGARVLSQQRAFDCPWHLIASRLMPTGIKQRASWSTTSGTVEQRRPPRSKPAAGYYLYITVKVAYRRSGHQLVLLSSWASACAEPKR